jgi:UDP-3-O-acyl-N-acetylglucosamine deacetylase
VTLAAIEGRGLHTGVPGAVRFERYEGEAVVVRASGAAATVAELHVVDTLRSTTIAIGGVRVGTVEHLFAAFAGLGIHRGVVVTIEGAEVPLAGGGARVYADALASLGVQASRPPLRVARDGVVELGESRYELRCNGATDPDAVVLEVAIDYEDARIATSAHWTGDAEDFRERIAVARTFGFERELGELLARGLASHVTPESVVVIGDDRVFAAGAPFTADEPARHKLLDLAGDLYLYGGPPRGILRAVRPGHAATHALVPLALERGLLVREG